MFVPYVQQADSVTQYITMKCLESDQTSKSADASHQITQRKLYHAKNVHDFRDLVEWWMTTECGNGDVVR